MRFRDVAPLPVDQPARHSADKRIYISPNALVW